MLYGNGLKLKTFWFYYCLLIQQRRKYYFQSNYSDFHGHLIGLALLGL